MPQIATQEPLEGGTPQEQSFSIEGKEVPFSELDPETVKSWYDSHTNKDRFVAESTRRSQQASEQRREAETYRGSVEKQLEDYNTMTSYLNAHPDLVAMINDYVGRSGGQGQQGYQQAQRGPQQQVPRQFNPERDEMMKRLEKIETGLGEEGRHRERGIALGKLKGSYGDFDEKKFNDYFMNKTGNFDNLFDLYNLVHLAMVGTEHLAAQAKQGTELDQGATGSGKVEPLVTIKSGPGVDTIAEAARAFAREKGIADF